MNNIRLRDLFRSHSYLQKCTSYRSFSEQIIIGKPMPIPTEYLVSAARVCLRMPTHGDTWFFVQPSTTVTEFKKACLQEDNQLDGVDILLNNKSVSEDHKMYELLEKREPL